MTRRHDEPSDSTPLLGEEATCPTTKPQRQSLEYKVIFLSCLIVFMVEFGAGLQIPSTIALLEQRLCHDASPGMTWPPATDDPTCKSSNVQSRLASLRGFQASLDLVPGLLTGMPYGMLSDRWGRKPVLLLAIAGYVLSVAYQVVLFFPIWMILLSTTFTFIGGSPSTISAMLFTSIAEAVAPARRSNVYFAIMALFILSEILSGPVVGIVIDRSSLALLVSSLGIFLATFAVGCVFPETFSRRPVQEIEAPLNHDACINDNLQESERNCGPSRGPLHSLRRRVSNIVHYTVNHKHLIALMASLIFVVLGRVVQEMLLQYTTRRYSWSWSQASFVLTIRSVSNLVVLIVVMPALSRALLSQLHDSAVAKDLWIARFSGVAGIIGFLLIGIAVNPTILCIGLVTVALGGGMSPALRSLLNNMVPAQQLGTLNSLIVLMELASMLVASPALAQSLSLGLRLGGGWIGLPFFCAAAIMMCSATIVWTVSMSTIQTKSQQLDKGLTE